MQDCTFLRHAARLLHIVAIWVQSCPVPADKLITTAEVAQVLGVSVKTVNQWASQGRLTVAQKLPGVRGANLYRRSYIEALANKRRATSVA